MVRQRHIPERTCIACGQKFPKRELVRIVRTPQGEITVDPTGKTAGRGAYLCKSAECWQRGARRGSLERAFRTSLTEKDREQLLSYWQRHHDETESRPEEN